MFRFLRAFSPTNAELALRNQWKTPNNEDMSGLSWPKAKIKLSAMPLAGIALPASFSLFPFARAVATTMLRAERSARQEYSLTTRCLLFPGLAHGEFT